jgi:16S rRNA processing protein RimM
VICAGVVARPHGLDGSFYVNAARPDLLQLGSAVELAGEQHVIVRRAGTDAHPIVRVEGCADRGAAELLRGSELLVADPPPVPLGPDEWLATDLEGAAVVDGAREVGVVRRLLALPSCECLDVQRSGGGDLLVPLVRDAIRAIDIDAKRIDVNMAFLGESDTV